MPTIIASPMTTGHQRLATQTNRFAHCAAEIEARAIELLESHPHFRGRSHWVTIQRVNRRLYLRGRLPSYYLKQLDQQTVRKAAGVERVEN